MLLCRRYTLLHRDMGDGNPPCPAFICLVILIIARFGQHDKTLIYMFFHGFTCLADGDGPQSPQLHPRRRSRLFLSIARPGEPMTVHRGGIILVGYCNTWTSPMVRGLPSGSDVSLGHHVVFGSMLKTCCWPSYCFSCSKPWE